MERHELLELTKDGIEYAWGHRLQPSEDDSTFWGRYEGIPAIYTGRSNNDCCDILEVGFSYPIKLNGVRKRIKSAVPHKEVHRCWTPWELIFRRREIIGLEGELIDEICEFAEKMNVRVGLFGSAALQIVTGFSYLRPDSDLDLVLETHSTEELEHFEKFIEQKESFCGIRIDAELKFSNDRYIKIKELFTEQQTILVKDGSMPRLQSRKDVWSAIQNKGYT